MSDCRSKKGSSQTTGFLIWRIFTSLLEQTGLVAVVLWGLPLIDINLPVWVLVPTSITLTIWNVYTYKKTSATQSMKTAPGFTDMVGTQGEVVSRLNPSGHVKIRGELWAAEAEDGELKPGRQVVVVKQNGLKLTVRETNQDKSNFSI